MRDQSITKNIPINNRMLLLYLHPSPYFYNPPPETFPLYSLKKYSVENI